MADIGATIETLENRLMRSWITGNAADVKKLLTRDFTFIAGLARSELLDRPSFVEGVDRGFACSAFRFREVHVKQHGRTAWFAAGCDLELRVASKEWTGQFWLTDLWRKSRLKRTWLLAERSLARVDDDEDIAASIRKLQLWT